MVVTLEYFKLLLGFVFIIKYRGSKTLVLSKTIPDFYSFLLSAVDREFWKYLPLSKINLKIFPSHIN